MKSHVIVHSADHTILRKVGLELENDGYSAQCCDMRSTRDFPVGERTLGRCRLLFPMASSWLIKATAKASAPF